VLLPFEPLWRQRGEIYRKEAFVAQDGAIAPANETTDVNIKGHLTSFTFFALFYSSFSFSYFSPLSFFCNSIKYLGGSPIAPLWIRHWTVDEAVLTPPATL